MQNHYEFTPQTFLLDVKSHSARLGFFCEGDIAVYFVCCRQCRSRVRLGMSIDLHQCV